MTITFKVCNRLSSITILVYIFCITCNNIFHEIIFKKKKAMNNYEYLAKNDDNQKLENVFLNGWKLYEFLEESNLEFNGSEFQSKVIAAMDDLELATRMVVQCGMFSSNELIDEVSTTSLQYLLLPFLLGKLVLKRCDQEREEVLRIAGIYFRDFIQRCHEYELCDAPKMTDKSNGENSSTSNNSNDPIQLLVTAATSRNYKIAQYRRRKELDEFIKSMKDNIRSENIDEEIKRDFYIKLLKKSIIEAIEELESVKMEKDIVEMRKVRLAEFGTTNLDDVKRSEQNRHHNLYKNMNDGGTRKILQPFIITRNAAQKAVFGLGYPSAPVMTVDEFYTQRVKDGVFPNAEQVNRMNTLQAEAATIDPNEKEDQEKAEIEEQIENDNPEYLQRMRNMDEYKDTTRRGDGNRYNRS